MSDPVLKALIKALQCPSVFKPLRDSISTLHFGMVPFAFPILLLVPNQDTARFPEATSRIFEDIL